MGAPGDIQIGGINEKQVPILRTQFGLATKVDSIFDKAQYDGTLGLAFSQYNGTQGYPFIMNAVTRGNFAKPVFTVYLDREVGKRKIGGLITYGGVDSYNCRPVFKYENVSSDYFYQFKIDEISLGQYKHRGQYKVELTFSKIMKGPPAIVAELAKAAGAQPTGDGITYSIDCNAEFQSLEIIAGSTKYKIDPDLLIMKLNIHRVAMLADLKDGLLSSAVLDSIRAVGIGT
ncbi:hypothetical protein Y032_0009g489 [Ancylostoma ceylanicum]|uniref:Peptidase A1 domain-containing protein n=1 Tax=Ancylostoma ceylanicum TaxID=53326 RepID=A0A016VI39_9BILA|nr:hypothetical protein Y032_0009g489 [Ancylostoma ceylanicum]